MIGAGHHSMMGGVKLPYDAEIEYLESTGTQWMVSNIVFTSGRIVITGSALSTFTDTANNIWRPFIGQSLSKQETTAGIMIAFYWEQTYAIRYCNWTNIQGSYATDLNPRFVYDLDTATGTLYRETGTYKGTVTNDKLKATAKDNPFVFFAQSANGAGAYPVRIYGIRVEIDGFLIGDFVPVRVGTTGELFDRVSGSFATRYGTFVIGPDVSAQNEGGGGISANA